MDLAAYFATRDASQDATAAMPVLIKGAVRADLADLFAQRGYTTGAEVGVYFGNYSEILCRANPGLHLYCIDRWAPYYSGASGKRIFTTAVRGYEAAKARLAPYHCTFMRQDSLEAAKTFADGSLDFVYLDADHWLPAVIADIHAWLPKVRKGGILAGHDYCDKIAFDNRVSIAVNAWTQATQIRPWFVLGRSKVRKGERTEAQRTWMWFV